MKPVGCWSCTKHRYWIVFALFALCAFPIVAQVGINSLADEYFDLLSLKGLVDRPYLSYRTRSELRWDWASIKARPGDMTIPQELADQDGRNLFLPEFRLFSGYNLNRPQGDNDGLLWQGRGYNGSAEVGFALGSDYLSMVFHPAIAYSENTYFETMPGTNPFAYFWGASVDAPQRFGASAYSDWDWGDSAIRATLPPISLGDITLNIPLTIGLGTEALWLGPARLNPILHSSNAKGYPRLDAGVGKTKTPIGSLEGRVFAGLLTESAYFDQNPSNNSRSLTGITASYDPLFIPGLTVALHRTMLSIYSAEQMWNDVRTVAWPFIRWSFGHDESDQRFSISFDYVLKPAGFELYLEWARNDFSPNLDYLWRYPFHSYGWTMGLRKVFGEASDAWWSLLEVEATELESSRDYEFLWPYSFYGHGIVTQGYTQEGQWLGAGIGTGSNAQTLSWSIFGPPGRIRFSLARIQKDNDYVWFLHFGDPAARRTDEFRFNAKLIASVSVAFALSPGFLLTLEASGLRESNPFYNPDMSTGASAEVFDASARMYLSWNGSAIFF
ncbi:MAG: hypothetical protein ACOYM2_04330 [Rectinemataceae bacterium]